MMFRFKSHPYKPLLRLISLTFQSTSPILNPKFFPFTFSLKFCTATSQSHSFTISYLINTLGFTPENALKASKRHRLETSQKKPDTVVAFFRSHGFSDSQVSSILRRSPQLLLCNPHKSVLPMFEFLASKGVSRSDIVLAVNKCPQFLCASVKNNIIPAFELMRTFIQSDKKTLDALLSSPSLLVNKKGIRENLKLLRDEGVKESYIAYFIRTRSSLIQDNWRKFRKSVDEVKELGFDPSKLTFVSALLAKTSVSKPKWNAKVEAFKSWGWSEEAFVAAFRKCPRFMLTSLDKINAIMSFWVNQLGWNSLDLILYPELFDHSLEKRIIPRAFVVQYLLTNGLMKKNASLYTPFVLTEKLFLEKYVENFKEETVQLIKLYQEGQKSNFQDKRED